jgi:hypothetical protein
MKTRILAMLFITTNLAMAQVGIYAGIQLSQPELKQTIGNVPAVTVEYIFRPEATSTGGLFVSVAGFQRTRDGVKTLSLNPDLGWFFRSDIISGEFQLQAGFAMAATFLYQQATIEALDARGYFKRWELAGDLQLITRWEGISLLVRYKPRVLEHIERYRFGGWEISTGFQI